MLPLAALTIFASAALLFLVQPLVGKLLLPRVGGSPAAWNTCMVFFQTLLLAGYASAHLAPRLGRLAVPLHLLLVLATATLLLFVPLELPAPQPDWPPILALLLALAVSVGLPFFVLSATAPLVQRWFAQTAHPQAHDPYFLYAASNLGSLGALLLYPFVLEPLLPVTVQRHAWALGFTVFAVLLALSAGRTKAFAASVPQASGGRQPSGESGRESQVTDQNDNIQGADAPRSPEAPTTRRVLFWVLYSAVPSSLLLGTTTYISSDLAPVPLLWVVPLALYLLTFVLAFARRQLLSPATMARVVPLPVMLVLLTMLLGATRPLAVLVPLHLLTLLVLAYTCHAALAADRPAPRYLTAFFLWLSVGGVLGGVFNALLAPMLFAHAGLVEYPLMLVVAGTLRPGWGRLLPRDLLGPMWVATIACLLTILLHLDLLPAPSVPNTPPHFAHHLWQYVLPLVGVYLLSRRPLAFGLALGAVCLVGTFTPGLFGEVRHVSRNFFGVLRVTDQTTEAGRFRYLFHGNTAHGIEDLDRTDPEGRALPLSYYHPTGPIGRVFAYLGASRPRGQRVAVVGLGTGSLAYYARPDQDWTFFEIDPAVEDIACRSGLFRFWSQCHTEQRRVVLGDARLRLAAEPDGAFDVLVLDAFTSDAIPLHLLTQEALTLYERKLAPGGVLAFHVSNRYLDLPPVLGRLALATPALLTARVWHDTFAPAPGKAPSIWVVMARTPGDLGPFARQVGLWEPIRTASQAPLWTDDFCNVWSVFLSDWPALE